MDQTMATVVLNPNWRDTVTFSAGNPEPQILAENEHHKVILAGLAAGSQIPAHPEGLATYHILEGAGWMSIDDRRVQIEAGATIITPDGASRGIEAETPLAFLAVRVTTGTG